MDLASIPVVSNGTDWLALIGLMAFLLSGVVAVAAVWRSSRNNTTLQNLKDAAESYKLKTEAQDVTIADMRRDHDAEVAGLSSRLADKDHELNELRGRVAVLQDLVTGKTALEQLAGTVADLVSAHTASENRILAAVAAAQQSVDALRGDLSTG